MKARPRPSRCRWLLRYWVELVHGYALDYVGPDRPVLPEGIENRDADVWEPLLTIAELAGGHWPERARVAAVAAVPLPRRTCRARACGCCGKSSAIFDRLKVGHISSGELVAELDETGEFAWSRLASSARRNQNGEHSSRATESVRVPSATARRLRDTSGSSFVDAWLRYLPPSGDNGDIGDNGDRRGDDDE